MNITTIKNALRRRAHEFLDECAEINCTELVESVAADLDIDALEGDPIWDWAVTVAEAVEKIRV